MLQFRREKIFISGFRIFRGKWDIFTTSDATPYFEYSAPVKHEIFMTM